MTQEITILIASLFGCLAIIFGAFGAHLLKKKLSAEQLDSFETGVKYQMYHAIALLALGLQFNEKYTNTILLFSVGVFLFSFSIYGLVLSGAFGKKMKFLGPITPLGGLCLAAGWLLLGISFL
ncbi:DUF423 domain-containing protein [uncultured Tenacibaculum sp.]|uniref:DUF423 domain-containing protein n=1 Tax=uncultured Tenacibaculum sp. TaxID=174713 RepID=UPI002614BFCE|nr:DUF423 domain-containing protein [uncultured Tenacibaculum sp.]